MTDLAGLISALVSRSVDFIIVGGAAATAHGSSRLTEDLDVVYRRSIDNLERLVGALAGYSPYLRGVPPGLPFTLDKDTLKAGLNFTLTTTLGPLDLLGEIPGGGTYEQLEPYTIRLSVFGHDCLCIELSKLIQVKRAAGRPKDLEAIAELEAILEERNRTDT